ncbi:unnamed protein product [Hyaloperonospora brassicae]|uniref:Glycosyltransferase 2-like domain-containing protein n=1 Tax=Hyaloperonospora brassicae TaxID=162125 RepID=A0AAV0TT16_HYABA|nr:unnamed protein product [Hyaloperonospora brassicae]
MSNCLLNGGADGTYVLSLDNDMKPHPKFLLEVLSLVFSQGEAFDGGEPGRYGFDPAAFVGTNAVFRRRAFDSIGGSQHGASDAKDSSRLCEGAVPETRATGINWKKRWTKGAVQILLMQNESEVGPDWRPPRVPVPDPKPSLAFPRNMFFYDSVLWTKCSVPALCYVAIAVYYLCIGDAPIYARGTNILYSFLPVPFCRWVLNLLANRAVDNNHKKRAQVGMVFVFVHHDDGSFEAIQARVTGKHKSRENTGAEHENATNLWNYVSAMLFGFFVMRQLYLMVKMSIPDYGKSTTRAISRWTQGIVAGTNDPAAATTGRTGLCREDADGVWPTRSRRRHRMRCVPSAGDEKRWCGSIWRAGDALASARCRRRFPSST